MSNIDTELGQSWSSYQDLGNGIYVYHDVLNEGMQIINRLERVLNKDNHYSWKDAMVGFGEKIPDYRNCVDFKYKKTDLVYDKSEDSKDLQILWQDIYNRMSVAVNHYKSIFNIGELKYWEAMNFVKYGPGQHFKEHHDHGYSYNCTVSLVGYPNDDYVGGELYFSKQNLKLKAKAGDLFIFPSNYMYPHTAMPVESGTKYSIVTMLDYSAKYHNPRFMQNHED